MSVDEASIKREKHKAREIRQSNWWQNKLHKAVCFYCQVMIPKEEVTMDHVVPLAAGGKSTKGNLVTCCKSCNNDKKSTNPVDYLLNLKE